MKSTYRHHSDSKCTETSKHFLSQQQTCIENNIQCLSKKLLSTAYPITAKRNSVFWAQVSRLRSGVTETTSVLCRIDSK